MKRLVIKEDSELKTTSVSNAAENKYYGAQKDDCKGLVVRKNYNHDDFTILATDEITNGNGWGDYDCHHLTDFLDNLIEDDFTVYEFSTFKELFAWLAE